MSIGWIFLIIIGVFLIMWFGWGILSPFIWEQPKYQVKEKLGKVQIREYAPTRILITETSFDGNAFGVLSSYIFGENKENQKIAMTTPVLSERNPENNSYRMVFFLPEKWKDRQLPTPKTGTNITFQTQDKKLIAAIRFYGLLSRRRRQNSENILLNTLKRNGYFTLGQPFLFQYSDPFVPPPLRRNEVGIIVYKKED